MLGVAGQLDLVAARAALKEEGLEKAQPYGGGAVGFLYVGTLTERTVQGGES